MCVDFILIDWPPWWSKNVTWRTRGSNWPFRCLDIEGEVKSRIWSKTLKLNFGQLFEAKICQDFDAEFRSRFWSRVWSIFWSWTLVDILKFDFDITIPDICHGRHGRRPCNFFLAGVIFYRFNAKNWHFWQILRKKVAFFYRFNAKNRRFWV